MQRLNLPSWPNGCLACVCLTFDVDADVGAEWRGLEQKLTSRSEARYGITRGLPRLLDVLDEVSVPGTFYVPGEIADRYPAAVHDIVRRGHEVGHHGYAHLLTDRASAADQQEEFGRGLSCLARVLGSPPSGYRGPGWELTPETFTLLAESSIEYDSSCMGDDRPYIEEWRGHRVLELPVHWSLDDWAYFGFRRDTAGAMGSDMIDIWMVEFANAVREHRVVTYTMHPEIMGRGYRCEYLRDLIGRMRDVSTPWFARHLDLARLVWAANPDVAGNRS